MNKKSKKLFIETRALSPIETITEVKRPRGKKIISGKNFSKQRVKTAMSCDKRYVKTARPQTSLQDINRLTLYKSSKSK